MTPGSPGSRNSPLASHSLGEHLLRGVAGLAVGALAIFLTTIVGPVSLLLLTFTAVAWRGCPTCWAIGLIATMADVSARRRCSRCSEEAHPGHPPSAWG
jgi:hypothetical protein